MGNPQQNLQQCIFVAGFYFTIEQIENPQQILLAHS